MNFPLAKRLGLAVFYLPAAMGEFVPLSSASHTHPDDAPQVPVMMTVGGARATDAAEKTTRRKPHV
ncbi:hypothetical protein IT570_08275 [Candidatus Sumerlaeota bacterium]|nr:hypothetical protein [Candidatus Sumerlaeota bacterium]